MDLTPETLRSATFRDKLRGYHPDDVDEFLESVARGLEVLLARLRDATEKARAVAPAQPAPQADEAIRTLALAQRTADLAVHEARTEAERLLKAAEAKAQQLVTTAEETVIREAEQAQAELRADLERLQATRDELFGEVNALGSWLEGERSKIKRALLEVAERVDAVQEPGAAPTPKPVTLPASPRERLEKSRAAAPEEPSAPARPDPAPFRPAPAPAAPTSPASAFDAPAATPPVTRPAASTPPPVERQKASPPVAAPSPQPPRQATPPGGQPAVRPTTSTFGLGRRGERSERNERSADAAVISQAAAAMSDEFSDNDPFLAELRAAMLDETPLGPRDDEEEEHGDPSPKPPRSEAS